MTKAQHQHVPVHWYEAATQSIAEKDAEIERLRAAHEEILSLWRKGLTVQIGEIALRALEPKP